MSVIPEPPDKASECSELTVDLYTDSSHACRCCYAVAARDIRAKSNHI